MFVERNDGAPVSLRLQVTENPDQPPYDESPVAAILGSPG